MVFWSADSDHIIWVMTSSRWKGRGLVSVVVFARSWNHDGTRIVGDALGDSLMDTRFVDISVTTVGSQVFVLHPEILA